MSLLDYLLKGPAEAGNETSSPSSSLPSLLPPRSHEKAPIRHPERTAACGSESCAGCYSVEGPDGKPRRIHPPKASADWEAWLRRWQPKGGRKQ